MRKVYCSLLLLVGFSYFSCVQAKAQAYEKICSQRYDYCFQIPPNFFMLTTGDVESASVSYKTVDGSSSISIQNGELSRQVDFHSLFLMQLGSYMNRDYRITLKKEYKGFFIFSGFTAKGRGFYQKVIKKEASYASAYLEFPKGNKKYSNVSQMIFDYFETTTVN